MPHPGGSPRTCGYITCPTMRRGGGEARSVRFVTCGAEPPLRVLKRAGPLPRHNLPHEFPLKFCLGAKGVKTGREVEYPAGCVNV